MSAPTELRTGWYQIGARKAYCIVRDEDVYVDYCDGYFTYAYHNTFRVWGATPIPTPVEGEPA